MTKLNYEVKREEVDEKKYIDYYYRGKITVLDKRIFFFFSHLSVFNWQHSAGCCDIQVIMPYFRCRNTFVCSPIGFREEIREVTFLPNKISVKWLTLV